eukprot:2693690-Amphidinium_carterae.1
MHGRSKRSRITSADGAFMFVRFPDASATTLSSLTSQGELTYALRLAGFDVVAVEYRHMHDSAANSVMLDLKQSSSWELLREFAQGRLVLLIHASMPAETFLSEDGGHRWSNELFNIGQVVRCGDCPWLKRMRVECKP